MEASMSGRILYVEDNPQNIRLVRKMLRPGNYEIIEAMDGHTGFEMAASERPDLILMDINLPDIDGVEVTKRIKAVPALANVPVIALTANAMHGDREHFICSGCDGYLAKPVTRNELLNMVSYFLEREVV
jgi:two-component system cell cycle response regulator DivK